MTTWVWSGAEHDVALEWPGFLLSRGWPIYSAIVLESVPQSGTTL